MCGLLLSGLVFTGCDKDDKEILDGTDAAVVANAYDSWTYFNIADGSNETLPIKGTSGAVTGVYYGNLSSSIIKNPDSLRLIITRETDELVTITLPEVLMGGMSADAPVETISFSAVAKAVKGSDCWTITGEKEIDTVESAGKKTAYLVSFNGKIGLTKGSAVELSIYFTPKAMYEANVDINMGGNYVAEVDNSYVYEVEGDESSFDWDIAVHKYDMRTNGGSVKELNRTDYNAVTFADVPADMVEDTEGAVIADMKNMMSGFVGYQDVKLNKELCKWVIATPTGSMPPYTYEVNDNVFILKVNGKVYKMKFSAYTVGGGTGARFVYKELK